MAQAKKQFKQQKPKLSRAAIKTINKKAYGDRPRFSKNGTIPTFNWYSANFEDGASVYHVIEQALEVLEFKKLMLVKQNKSEICKQIISTDWTVADQIIMGEVVDSSFIDRLLNRFNRYCEPYIVRKTNNVVNITDYKFDKIVEEIDFAYDQILNAIFSNQKTVKLSFSINKLYEKYKPSLSTIANINKHYKQIVDELKQARDNQIDGYSNYSKAQLNSLIQFLEVVINFKPLRRKTTRVTTKTKTSGSKSKIVASYKQLIAVSPGSKIVTVLISLEGASITFNGKTYSNFDPSLSFSKRCGKYVNKLTSSSGGANGLTKFIEQQVKSEKLPPLTKHKQDYIVLYSKKG